MVEMTTLPDELNGVSLYTRAGERRQRFSEADRLKMLGGFESELEVFIKLFAPRKTPYISRHNGAGWQTVHHALQQDDVVRHLLANRIPGVEPIWIGTGAWKRTMHAAIDVDLRGDEGDFKRRCKQAEKVLRRLGITKERMLICSSPSGGRHYRFFFRRPVFTDQLPNLFEMAGLPLEAGKFEVFPSETKHFRLPFGHTAGRPHNSTEWVEFIQAYQDRRFPRVNWDQMVRRAQNIQQRSQVTPTEQQKGELQTAHSPKSRALVLGLPKGRGLGVGNHRSTPAVVPRRSGLRDTTDLELSRRQIQKTWMSGIVEPGTRLSLTKSLAWHLIFAERLSAAEVSRMLIEWVYRTGRNTSKDVQADLCGGSRKVEEQTCKIVEWYESQRRENRFRPRRVFVKQELDHIIRSVSVLPEALRFIRARFILDFLNFAKKRGLRSKAGYECMPSVDGVIKKWENCRNASHYKPHLDWAVKAGLIVFVKEKSQRAHRPRTYAVAVPITSYEDWSLGYQEGLDYLQEALAVGLLPSVEMPSHSNPDGYRGIASLVPREFCNQPGDRCGEKVEAVGDPQASEIVKGFAEAHAYKAGPVDTDLPTNVGEGSDYGNDSVHITILSNGCTSDGSNPERSSECQHQGSPTACLAGSPSTSSSSQQAIQGMDGRSTCRLSASSEDVPRAPPFPIYESFRECPTGPCGDLASGQNQCHRLGPVPQGICHRLVGDQPVVRPGQFRIDPAPGSDTVRPGIAGPGP